MGPVRGIIQKLLPVLIPCWLAVGLAAGQEPAEPPDRPAERVTSLAERAVALLSTRCVGCHGPGKEKGGLDLSTRDRALEGGDSGPALVPGTPAESLLIDRIEAGEMPPKDRLNEAEVELVRAWIEAGAPLTGSIEATAAPVGPWWAVARLVRPAVPRVEQPPWGNSAIDAFIHDRLERAGFPPAPAADRRTLLRRVTFDLTGLPPTREATDRFLASESPAAFEREVDRLLASPAYGEKWARHWLDVAHFAETHGYDKDKRRNNAWPYRDYVIRALNADIPYPQFLREQVAGDVLDPENPESVAATGFLVAGPWDFVGHVELAEGTVEKARTRVLDRDDMVASTLSTFASLTVHCARCHDHKFDPISTREYYSLQAVFAGIDRGDRLVDDAQTARLRAELLATQRENQHQQDALSDLQRQARSTELEALDRQIGERAAVLNRLDPARETTPSQSNGYHSAIHPRPDAAAWVEIDLGQVHSVSEIRVFPARPTDFPDAPGFGFPASLRIFASEQPIDADTPELARLDRDRSEGWPDAPWVVRSPANARFVRLEADRLWKRTGDYVFALGEVQVLAQGRNVARGAAVRALDSIEAGRWSTKFLVDGFDSRRALPDPADPGARDRDHAVTELLDLHAARSSLAWRIVGPTKRAEWDDLQIQARKLARSLAELPPPRPVFGPLSHEPRPVHVLNRGEVEQPREEAHPSALGCIPGLDADLNVSASAPEGQRRLMLANWLSSPDNPLCWRSIANRIWHYHFGRGLVDTPNDFGKNGSVPTHPDLLDWLAAELRDGPGGWKPIHRLIVTSATYRQASLREDGLAAVDQENRLLGRQNRRRLEPEELRDAILSVSGSLDRRMYGPGFDLFGFHDDHSPVYDHDDPDAAVSPSGRRRAIYRFVTRSVPNPWLDCLDGADPNASVPVRNATVTPLQALALLNDRFVLHEAELLANRLISGPESQSIASITEYALGRPANPNELGQLESFAARHGPARFARLLFNLNAFSFVD